MLGAGSLYKFGQKFFNKGFKSAFKSGFCSKKSTATSLIIGYGRLSARISSFVKATEKKKIPENKKRSEDRDSNLQGQLNIQNIQMKDLYAKWFETPGHTVDDLYSEIADMVYEQAGYSISAGEMERASLLLKGVIDNRQFFARWFENPRNSKKIEYLYERTLLELSKARKFPSRIKAGLR